MTLALRAHRLLCRLGLHLWGRKRLRRNVAGSVQKCASCNRTRTNGVETPTQATRAAKDAIALAEAGNGGPDDATLGDRKRWEKDKNNHPFPVDALNFPPINRQPRDGVTHEG